MGWTSAAARHHLRSCFLLSPKAKPISFLQTCPPSLSLYQRHLICCFLRCCCVSPSCESTPADRPITGTKPRAFLNGSRRLYSVGYGVGRRSCSGGARRTEFNDDVRFEAARIVNIVERGEESMERELKSNLGPNLPSSSLLISEVIRFLSARGALAVRFFRWIQATHRGHFSPSSDMYNVLVDNVGRAGDYKTMLLLLQEMSSLNLYLTENAFGFLTSMTLEDAKPSALKMIEVLNEVGGQCRGSGMHSLIRSICNMKAFDLAISVVHEAGKQVSLYNIIIAEFCRHGDFQGARSLLELMRDLGCHPTITSYNYLLGSLFKNNSVSEGCELLQTMKGLGYMPDEVTYEIIILQACRSRNMDYATETLHLMLSNGLKPRLTTHAGLIKGYFLNKGMTLAHKYVVDMSVKDRCSTNMNYSLLANLFLMSGRLIEACSVLNEMMEKGLRPNFPVYVKTVKDLRRLGMVDHAACLAHRFSVFPNPAHFTK